MLLWLKVVGAVVFVIPCFLIAALALLFLMLDETGTTLTEAFILLGTMTVAGGLGIGTLVLLWRWVLYPGLQDPDNPGGVQTVAAWFMPAPLLKMLRERGGPGDAAAPDGAFVAPVASSVAGSHVVSGSAPPASTDVAEPAVDYLPDGATPWTVRPEWRRPRLSTDRATHDNIAGNRTVLLAGGSMLSVGLLVGSLTLPTLADGWPLSIIFGAIGAGILTLGYVRWRRKDRFGATTFAMDPFPGALGGPFCGVLHTGVRADDAPADGFRVVLSCYRRRLERDSDGGPSVTRDLMWRDEKQMTGRRSDDGPTLDVPVVFEPPADRPPSPPEKTPERVQWLLEVSAAMPGVDYAALLEVPVFPVRPDPEAPVDAHAAYELHHEGDTPTSEGITVRRTPESLTVTFGRARRPVVAAAMTVGGVLLGTLALALIGGGLGNFAFGAAFAGLLVALMAAALTYGAYYYWTYRSQVTVDRSGVRVRAGVWGRETTTHLPCAALEKVRLGSAGDQTYDLYLHRSGASALNAGASTMKGMMEALGASQAGTGEAWDTYFARYGQTGNQVVAARMLSNHREAEWIATQIQEAAADHARYG
jgi:hypothetical protein